MISPSEQLDQMNDLTSRYALATTDPWIHTKSPGIRDVTSSRSLESSGYHVYLMCNKIRLAYWRGYAAIRMCEGVELRGCVKHIDAKDSLVSGHYLSEVFEELEHTLPVSRRRYRAVAAELLDSELIEKGRMLGARTEIWFSLPIAG